MKNENILGYIGYQLLIATGCAGEDGRNRKTVGKIKRRKGFYYD